MSQPNLTSNLDRKFVSGLAWTTASKWLIQVGSWVSSVVVARLLSPVDYGLVELAGVVIMFSQALFELGVGNAIIQLHELTDDTLRQINSLLLLMAGLVYTGVFLATPSFARFFNEPLLVELLLVYSLIFFITASAIVPANILRRNLDYRTLAASDALLSIVQLAVTLTCALNGLAFWSLVVGQLAGRLSATAFVVSRKPMGYSWPHWKDVGVAVRFGYKVAIGEFGWAVHSQADAFAIGKNLGGASLGSYRMALSLAMSPIDKIASLVTRVTTPIFAHVQHDHALMRRYLLRFSEIIALVTIPASIGLACVAPELIQVVLGEKWLAVIAPLQLLSFTFAFRCYQFILVKAILALRKASFHMSLSLANTGLMCVLFWLTSYVSIEAVALCWIAVFPFSILPMILLMRRTIQLRLLDYFHAGLPATLGGGAIFLSVFFARQWMHAAQLPVSIILGVSVAVGALVYPAFLLLFFRKRTWKYVDFLLAMRSGKQPLIS